MRRKKKKIRKLRGTRTVARGRSKRGRGRGSRMGRGSVKSKGGGYRNFMHIVKYEPWRFHQKGFRSMKRSVEAINVGNIEKIIKGEDIKEINILEHGHKKVTGRGNIKKALTVKAYAFSKTAKEKIEKAGGKAVVIGEVKERKDKQEEIEVKTEGESK